MKLVKCPHWVGSMQAKRVIFTASPARPADCKKPGSVFLQAFLKRESLDENDPRFLTSFLQNTIPWKKVAPVFFQKSQPLLGQVLDAGACVLGGLCGGEHKVGAVMH